MWIIWLLFVVMVHRSLTIYNAGIKTEQTLQNQSFIITSNDDIMKNMEEQSKNRLKRYAVIIGITFLSFVLLMTSTPGVIRQRYQLSHYSFVLAFLIMIVMNIVILIKARKIKDAIWLYPEMWFSLLSVSFAAILEDIAVEIDTGYSILGLFGMCTDTL